MHSVCLNISIRFLLDEFHGRGDQGDPEWPPSPLRLFQALVHVAARQGGAGAGATLEWIERQPPPTLIATPPDEVQPRYGFKNFVPDNVGDLMAKSWVRAKDDDISNYRTAKDIRPTRLREKSVVHYLWPLADAASFDLAECKRMARAISAFGWGVDMAVADAALITSEAANALAGERWLPTEVGGSVSLRMPTAGTLAALRTRYEAFLDRISLEKDAVFKPVHPLATFARADYRKASEMAKLPVAVFALRKPDDSGFATFATARKGLHLGGMLRHCAARIAPQMGWDEKRVAEFVLGHGETRGAAHTPVEGSRLVLIPLPSIEWRGANKGRTAGPIRRVLVTVKGSVSVSEFSALTRALEGGELIDEKTHQAVAFLRRQSADDGAIRDYCAQTREWVSVTPVILPGHDDRNKLRRKLSTGNLTPQEKVDAVRKLESRIETLLRKALRQSALPEEIIAGAQFEWRGSGFLPGVELASEYAVSDQHRRFRRVHCRIVFDRPVSGPLCIGGGRFLGLGLFAAMPEAGAGTGARA
jgi:CRISPR-associated protein Csb2